MTASENITRAEAKERSALVETRAYEVVLDVTSDGPTFSTVTTVTFGCRQPGASTWIDLIAPTVHSVVLNGVDLDVSAVVDGPRITLPDLQADNLLVVTADGAFMNTGEGLHRFVDPVDKETYLYTQFESADSRRMYASFEQPDLKATFGLTVTAPSHWQVVSNSPTPEPDNHGDGTATWAFEPTPRISTYITALVAGPYHRVTRLLHRHVRHLPPRRLLPRVTRAVPRLRRDPHRHQAGLRVLRGAVRRRRTRSRSTTSCSCRSSTPARWRTPAA